jgi:hypothetical protein
MKIIFIYLVIVLAIAFYVWINIFKEGNQDSDLAEIQNIINGNGKTTTQFDKKGNALTDQDTNVLTSTAVSPGITTIDRYYNEGDCPNDKSGNKQYIYCVDGNIECQDIFGARMNILQSMDSLPPYLSGNTYTGCGSYINKVNLSDYSTKIGDMKSTGVFFDLSNCSTTSPWRVGGTITTPGKNPTISSYTCYTSQKEAQENWNLLIDLSLNANASYNVNDAIYILSSFLETQASSQILKILDNNNMGNHKSYTTINNQKYYYGTIKAKTGDTYTVTVPNSSIDIINVPKSKLLKDSLYNPLTNDYYSNLGSNSKPRPVCKSGRFTSCLSSQPFTIKNGVYVSTNDPILTLDGSYDKYRNQSQIDYQSIPFSTAPVNPSGIIDKPINSLLEYNYFTSQNNETPFIKCKADYGTNIGDPLCCNQEGILKDTKYICPQEVPTCSGYSANDDAYGYCN